MGAITTMVCLHDLLGFGNMVSASGGTFDSAVGETAHKRIELLRKRISDISTNYPDQTRLFQLNDSVVAICDLDISFQSDHVNPGHVSSNYSPGTIMDAIRFVWASSKLHISSIEEESQLKIGPSGRTFLVLGQRWPVTSYNDSVNDVSELQANLAFAEAYMADSGGSELGFDGKYAENLYMNDHLMNFIGFGKVFEDLRKNIENKFDGKVAFPYCMATRNAEKKPKKISTKVFHRDRIYYQLKGSQVSAMLSDDGTINTNSAVKIL